MADVGGEAGGAASESAGGDAVTEVSQAENQNESTQEAASVDAWAPVFSKGSLKEKIKVFGEDEEIEIKSKDDLMRHIQKSRAFDRRFPEFKQITERAKELIELAQSDEMGLEVLRKLGKDPRKLAQAIVEEEYRRQSLSPEQIELEEARERLRHYEAQEKQSREQQEQAAKQQQVNDAWQEFYPQLEKAFGEIGLDLDEDALELVAIKGRQMAARGEHVTAKALAEYVKSRFDGYHQKRMTAASPEELYKQLGDKAAAISKQHAQAALGAKGNAQARSSNGQFSQQPKARPESPNDVLDRLRAKGKL